LVDNPDSFISFLTFDNGLSVISTAPADGATDVPVSTVIQAVFSTDISFSSITSKSFVVADETFIPVTGTYAYDAASRTVTFTPLSMLMYITGYNVMITSDVKDLNGNSLVAEKIWLFRTIPNGTIPAPAFTPPAGTYEGAQSIVIVCPDPGATIRYTTDDSNPTGSSGTIYGGSFTVSENTIFPVKAIAYRHGYTDSPVVSASYLIQAMTPVISPPAGVYSSDQTLYLSTSTPGAAIYYTLNGVNPTPSDFDYSLTGPFTISADTTVKAIAVKTLMSNSPVLTAPYIINTLQVAPPVFTPPIGTYTSSVTVNMTSATAGATIKYTTDGSDPSVSNGTVGTSVHLADTTVLKAYAYYAGMTDSAITNSAGVPYLIAPRINAIIPGKGPNTAPVSVTIKGSYFKAGATARLALAGYPDIVASSLAVVDSGTITCTFDITGAFETKWDVIVANTDGGSSTNVKYFRIY